jgi:hypothetical protein
LSMLTPRFESGPGHQTLSRKFHELAAFFLPFTDRAKGKTRFREAS